MLLVYLPYIPYLLEIVNIIDEKRIDMGYLNMCFNDGKMEKYWIENFSINVSCRWTCCVMSDNLIVLTHCTDHLRQSFKKQWTHLIESGLWLLYWIILRSNFLIIKFSSLRHQLVIISTYLLNQTQRCLDLNQGLLPIQCFWSVQLASQKFKSNRKIMLPNLILNININDHIIRSKI